MTKGGDHGGESYLETGAALFVYSRRQLFCNKQVLLSNNREKPRDNVPFSARAFVEKNVNIANVLSHTLWWNYYELCIQLLTVAAILS